MRHLCRVVISLGVVWLAQVTSAQASLVLMLDQGIYHASAAVPSVAVQVLLAQTAGGPQVGPGNELLTAGLALTFDVPPGIATLPNVGAISPSPAFDAAAPALVGNVAQIAETSLLGIADFSVPVLLGTFTFTAQADGETTLSVASLGPGSSFITALGDLLDPSQAAQATIHVTGFSVPEPASVWLALSALACGALVRFRQR